VRRHSAPLGTHVTAPPPPHEPALQTSPVVQALPSLHGPSKAGNTQPNDGLQPSLVHGLPSVQTSAAPPAQAPPPQVSASVHALPSLQGAVFAALLHPLGPHASSVHGLPSSQLAAGPGVQPLALHVSPTVQVLPSLQAAPTFTVLLQPLPPQLSIVHGFPSSQLAATHAPPQHICPPVQLDVRLQVAPAHAAVVQPSLVQVDLQSHVELHRRADVLRRGVRRRGLR